VRILSGVIFCVSFPVILACAEPAAARPAAPSGAGHTLKTAGIRLWYEVRGSGTGTPLVLVNGGPGFDHTYELCSDVWDTLAKERRVVLYDQRGNGRSSALEPGHSCTLLDQISDLEALRAALHAEKMDLLGHSWGGYLVMAYAAKHPDRVSHLVICDSAAPKWSDTEFIFKYVYPETIEKQGPLDTYDTLGDPKAAEASLHEYLTMLFVSREKRDEFVSREKDYHYTRAVNEALNADLARYDLWPVLPSFTLPTLVVTGRFDMNVAPSTAWKIHKAIPESRFVVFEKSGHFPFFEEPEAFVEAVRTFLGRAD
jgi:proline iminopeptidase